MTSTTDRADKELIDSYLGGDRESFAKLVERWEHQVVNLAHRLTGDLDDARDIGQLTFVKLFRRLDSFNGTSRFSTWLYQVVVNACRDRLRARGAALRLAESSRSAAAACESVELSTPERVSERREAALIVSGAVGALAEAEREVVVLRHYEERTFSEIAAIVGAPVSTVKSRMERAINKLRPLLKGLEG